MSNIGTRCEVFDTAARRPVGWSVVRSETEPILLQINKLHGSTRPGSAGRVSLPRVRDERRADSGVSVD